MLPPGVREKLLCVFVCVPLFGLGGGGLAGGEAPKTGHPIPYRCFVCVFGGDGIVPAR